MDCGADLCCDSAHKTLPVLTGGAYLHISEKAPVGIREGAKQAMALFGSTSPSYLILQSLDLCNHYISREIKANLVNCIAHIKNIKTLLSERGWAIEVTDPLKLTLRMPNRTIHDQVLERLEKEAIEWEYADGDYIVLMLAPHNAPAELERIVPVLGRNEQPYEEKNTNEPVRAERVCSIREALFAPQMMCNVKDSVGKICGTPTVGCPPAIPIAVPGERINEAACHLFEYYDIGEIAVINE
jgi:arginine/lysine/ornithine decarboxylase